jgi:hypothetical protein
VGGHPLRFDDAAFNDFLGALRKPSGGAVGGTWASGGRDEDRIIILCRSLRYGGANTTRRPTGRYICVTLGGRDHHEIEDHLSGFGKDVLPDSIPARVNIEVLTRAAHELGHSLMLGDEYGGDNPRPTDAEALKRIAKWANIQARATLVKGSDLHGDEIKWRWPRIEKAGVLAVRLPSGGGYRVVLERGHGKPFVKGDVVRLRLRPLLTAGRHSDRFIVDKVTGDELQLVALVAPPFVPGNFQPGSVLFAAVRGPDPNPADHKFGEDLQLVHEATVARINATHNPLNTLDPDHAPPNRNCQGEAETPTPATNFPDGKAPKPPLHSPWIVGLYENGGGFDCDVYRPTGVCLMRRRHFFDETKSTESSYQFCTVCRYVMVDLLDPSLHGLMDQEYEPRYPK